jgi:hypothetical protein
MVLPSCGSMASAPIALNGMWSVSGAHVPFWFFQTPPVALPM